MSIIASFMIPVVLYFLMSHLALKKRVDVLEQQILAQDLTTDPSGVVAIGPDGEAELEGAKTASHTDKDDPFERATIPLANLIPKVSRAKATQIPEPTKAVVFNRQKMAALLLWLKDNWFYAVSAMSLALAGVFLVQYGSERGLLPPVARVWAALVFGGVLIAAGEYLRRRFGDQEGAATAYLPSTFSGAGLVTLFAGVLSARLMYGLIGPEMTLVTLVLIAGLAIVLGWFYGPFLAAIGIIGAMSAPFLVGGESDAPDMIYAYFALVTVVGLFIDAIRRWAWVSVVALFLGFAAGGVLHLGGANSEGLLAMVVVLALASIGIPVLRLRPDHGGPMTLAVFARFGKKGGDWPEFPTFLAAGGTSAATAYIVGFSSQEAAGFWLALVCLTVLFAGLSIWAARASALTDIAAFPLLGVLAMVALQGDHGAVWKVFQDGIGRLPEAPTPRAASAIFAVGCVISLIAVWRSFKDQQWPHVWGVAAAFMAPAVLVLLDVFWQPARVIGAYPWAWHAAVLALALFALAERYARRDGDNHLRRAMAVLASLTMISFACMILLTTTALTLAIAVTVLAAVVLDRRFDLPLLSVFIQAGVVVVGARLVINPGIEWATWGPIGEVAMVFIGAIVAFVATYLVLAPLKREATKTMLESAILANTGIFLSVLLTRWFEARSGSGFFSHWSLSLNAMIWMCVSFAQFYRVRSGGVLSYVRRAFGVLFGAMAAVLLVGALTIANPLIGWNSDVVGPIVVNSLMVAYLLPALLLALAAKYLWPHRRKTVFALNACAVGLAVFYIALAIRHFWQGPDLSRHGTTQPELYSYTLALLIAGSVLLYQGIVRKSSGFRRAAMGVIALTVVKVFFVDISGLQGLTRVFSLLALGLSLSGLAWLNRWADGKGKGGTEDVGNVPVGHGETPPPPQTEG